MKQRKLIALLCALSMIFTLFVPAGAETAIQAGLQEDGSFLIGNFTDLATATSFRTTSKEGGTGHYLEPPLNYMTLNWTTTNGAQGEGYMAANQDVFGSLDFSEYGLFNMKFAIEKKEWSTYNKIQNYFTIVLSTAQSGALPATYYQNECLFYEVDLSQFTLTDEKTVANISVPLSEFRPAFDGVVNGVQGATDGKVDLKDIKSFSIMSGAFGFTPNSTVGKYPGTDFIGWTFYNANTTGGKETTTCGFGIFEIALTKQATVAAKELDPLMAGYTRFAKNTTITLPAAVTNATVVWASSHPAIISTEGVVTMPVDDTDVTLTATVTATDGTTATKTYTIKVFGTNYAKIAAGKQADGSYLIGDFSDGNTSKSFNANSKEVGAGGGYDGIAKYLTLNWTTTVGSQGENYIYGNPVTFADLDFSEYSTFDISFALDRNDANIGANSIVNNYMTIVLTTAEKDAIPTTFCENECLYYEIDLRQYPITVRNRRVDLSIPFADFKVAFDGMKNNVQGTADGKVDLKDIKSISLVAAGFGNLIKNGPGSNSAKWAFTNAGGVNEQCGSGVYYIKLKSAASSIAATLDPLMADINRIAKNTTLDLPNTLTDATVTWASSHPAIISNDGVVTLPENDTDVVLTATISANDGTTATKAYTVKVFGTNCTKLVAGKQADGSYLIGDFSDVTTATAMKDGSAENSSIDTINKWYTLGWLSTGISSRAENYIYNNPVTFADLDFSEYGVFSMDFAICKQLWQKHPSIQNYFTIVLSTAEKDAQRSNYKNNECLYYEIDLSKYALTGEISKFNLTVPFSEFTLAFDGMVNGAEVAAKKDGKINLADIKSISILGADFGSKWVTNGTGCNLGTDWTFKNSGQDNNNTCGGGLYNIRLLKQASIVADELDAVMEDYEVITENTTIALPTALTNATITWSSDNEAVLSKNGVAVMPENDTVVTLVANITANDGSTAEKTYKITVCGTNYVRLNAGKQADGSYLLGDFTTKEMADVFKVSGAENSTGGWDSVNKFFSMNWTVNVGSRGENYIYNNPVVFKDLDFSDYGIFNIKFAIDRTNYQDLPVVENYMTIVLTTAKKGAVPNTFCENECLYYEINLRDYPITGGTKRIIELAIPFSEFKVAFDGVSGAKDGKVNLEDIKSLSLVAGPFGSRIKNGPGSTDSGYWAFTNSGAAKYDNGVVKEVERCGAGLYSMSLSNYAVSKPVIYSGDSEFTNMNQAAEVYGKVECIVTNNESKVVNGIIALYKGGQLKAVQTGDITLVNGTISTSSLSYDPENYDVISVYLWDKTTMAPITVKTTLNK